MSDTAKWDLHYQAQRQRFMVSTNVDCARVDGIPAVSTVPPLLLGGKCPRYMVLSDLTALTVGVKVFPSCRSEFWSFRPVTDF